MEIRAYAPELPTGWLVSEVSDGTIAQVQALGLTQICPKADSVTSALVRRLHAEAVRGTSLGRGGRGASMTRTP